ncbi:protein DEFECTIVE IN MERISTEM SILENCING 3 [Dendrobium catenatum]|uniref:protein DEFECTIVE IN MERISTEM SILENCING 3 n=1 Tax=Dendrobium catenatum TaxID=906689 RepID=UPI0010A03C50|nr:protein DEFECTIVE IN MERISTEM SILENCING 3 [Dendrobium catenatum]
MAFEKSFRVKRRELRVLSRLPESCLVGSCLENIVFGVFDSEGEIDHTIHGKHHALSISALSGEKADKIMYMFDKGLCTVPVVQVPSEPKIFIFSASHSNYPDLHTIIKVNVVQEPKLNIATSIELVDRNPPVPSNEGLSESQDHSLCSPSLICILKSFVDYTAVSAIMLFLFIRILVHFISAHYLDPWQQSIRLEYEGLVDSGGKFADYMKRGYHWILIFLKLDDEAAELGYQVGQLERNLKILNYQRERIVEEILELKVFVDQQQLSQIHLLVNTKEHVRKQVEEQGNTAAAAFFHLFYANTIEGPQFDYVDDIIGVVALLGIVSDYKLSSILAEYLGESYMLAIVCKSYETARELEKHSEDGAVNHNCALHAAAAAVGIRIQRRFNVICLEEIRPYEDPIYNDTQRKLAIPAPRFPSGEIPNGFLGYAVNLITLDSHHSNTRTASGFGLRETLFYQLFGKLQVYKTRAEMQQASSCIDQAAVSLDGGIIVTSGIIVFGDCEPEIKFPVVPEFHDVISNSAMKILKQIEDKKAVLEAKNKEIEKKAQAHSKTLAKFHKKKEILCSLLPHL